VVPPLCPPFFPLRGYPGSAELVLGCPPFFLRRGYPSSAKLVLGRPLHRINLSAGGGSG